MENPEAMVAKLNLEFDQMLADMKPHVMRLPHKSERQRCALWIKKFCEPPASGITARKNRNMYAQLLLHMLKRGVLEGPFTTRPDPGSLPTLPSYMSIYFDDAKISTSTGFEKMQLLVSRSLPIELCNAKQKKNVPDWVQGELGSESSSFSSSLPYTGALGSGIYNRQYTGTRERFAAAFGSPHTVLHSRCSADGATGGGMSAAPFTQRDFKDPPFSFMPGAEGLPGAHEAFRLPPKEIGSFPSNEPETHKLLNTNDTDYDWAKGLNSTTFTSTTGTTFRDDPSLFKLHERELDMKGKMVEAKFQEEKLKLQQKHDNTVQKILDRKNAEIEELKTHYRNKLREQEENTAKTDKKVGALQKEMSNLKESKEKQIQELKQLSEQSQQTRQHEYEKKYHDAVADFEQEKFELQKIHTKNIQELLDDTNHRLHKMESEYQAQATATSGHIKELESRLHQVASEAETTAIAKSQMDREKIELEGKVERLTNQLQDYEIRCTVAEKDLKRRQEDHHHELKTMKNKMEANEEFLKQENNLSAVKAADSIAELEQHIVQLKVSIEKSENERHRQIRELETNFQQDKIHLENLHDKKVRSLEKEMDEQEQQMTNRIRKLEQSIKEKDADIRKQLEQHREASQKAEQVLSDFKAQMERNTNKMYEDMKKQMEHVEGDLVRSKQLREKQAKEFQRQLEDERQRHEQKVAELKMNAEQDKAQMLRDVHMDKELMYAEKERDVEHVRESLKRELEDSEKRAKEKSVADAKSMAELEIQLSELREQLVHANQLRKQQLVELGLLREEEKQKMQHEHESQLNRHRSEFEQRKLDQEKKHSAEMEQMLDKTNSRLKEIEKEYTARSNKSSEAMNELQKTIQSQRDDQKRQREQAEQQLNQTTSRLEEEKRRLKQQHQSMLMQIQQDLESQKNKTRQLERRIAQEEQDHEEKVTELRSQYEETMRGLIPVSVRMELEDTIQSLKSQVRSLEQRTGLLQDELEMKSQYSASHQSFALSGSLAPASSLKSSA